MIRNSISPNSLNRNGGAALLGSGSKYSTELYVMRGGSALTGDLTSPKNSYLSKYYKASETVMLLDQRRQ